MIGLPEETQPAPSGITILTDAGELLGISGALLERIMKEQSCPAGDVYFRVQAQNLRNPDERVSKQGALEWLQNIERDQSSGTGKHNLHSANSEQGSRMAQALLARRKSLSEK